LLNVGRISPPLFVVLCFPLFPPNFSISPNFATDAIDTSGNPHTADYLAAVMGDCMKNVRDNLKAVVVGIVTDNASNMANMRSQLASWASV
jgi:hypothetical protein